MPKVSAEQGQQLVQQHGGTFHPDTGQWEKGGLSEKEEQALVTGLSAQSNFEESLGLAHEGLALQAGISKEQLEIMREQMEIAKEQWGLYKEIYSPIEKRWAKQAAAGIPADYYIARAGQDVTQAYDKSRRMYARQLESMGINPADPRYASIMRDVDIAESAAEAGAKTNSRMAINDANFARLGNVAQTGRGVPTESANVMSGAANTASQASATAARGYDAVLNAYNNLGNYYGGQQNMFWQGAQQDKALDAQTEAAMWGGIGELAGKVVQAAGSSQAGG